MDGVENGENTDPVGDKVRCIFTTDDPFTKRVFRKIGDKLDHIRAGCLRRNELNQIHITRWIEEMCPEEAFLVILREIFRDPTN